MINAFPYQFLIKAINKANDLPYPNFLRDLVRKVTINDFEKLQEFFNSELSNSSLQTEQQVNYFLFISQQALHFSFFRHDQKSFQENLEMMRHRLIALRSIQAEDINVPAWEKYLDHLNVAFLRILKQIPRELYEKNLNQLDWNSFDKDFISQLSTIIGYVYLNESETNQISKSRLWLQKSIMESSFEENLLNYYMVGSHFLQEPNGDSLAQVQSILSTLKEGSENLHHAAVKTVFGFAIFELETNILQKIPTENPNDPAAQLEESQREISNILQGMSEIDNLPAFTQAAVEAVVSDMQMKMRETSADHVEQEHFGNQAIKHIDAAIELAESAKAKPMAMQYKLHQANISIDSGNPITEKDLKDIVQYYKKSRDYPRYIQSLQSLIHLLDRNGHAFKSFDIVSDLFKFGNKRLDEGGFYLILEGFKLATDVFTHEAQLPGVSWMVQKLDGFFERIKEVIDYIHEHNELIGASQVKAFQQEYLRFELVSNFNIIVFYQYQLYALKIMQIVALLNGDSAQIDMMNMLIKKLENDNNPLSFIKGEWGEFKDVPNDVRNKTLNTCINISKGDLPLAAEHLDFSYRNLRSYITFKEVNRLGFFLDISETNNRQLEQGIRYMFYDLYKQGTIFEVVFDMPKFLVNHANSGFYSQDLEKELNIKGTTAKKYIKIMMEIELIRQDKATGRKHFYRLIRENVMKRLGADPSSLI